MLNLNSNTLAAVVDKAMQDASQHPRWLNAIDRAVRELVSNPYLERQDGHLLIASSTSGNIYSANGVCQCQAYAHGIPCWHRAAARLVRLHDERQAGLMTMPEGDVLDTEGMRVVRSARYAEALASINELF